jgi:hypothetical protein
MRGFIVMAITSTISGETGELKHVQISGLIENQRMFEHLLTYEPDFDRNYRKLIRQALREARNKLSRDAKAYIQQDPRRAARAVKSSVYKQLFGGNLSILQKRSAGTPSSYRKPRTLRPGQRGGNRRPRNDARNRLDKYQGADRGFILRFLNSGTVERSTIYGNRGYIRQTDWFGHTAPWHIEEAAEKVANTINEYIKNKANG